MPPAGDLGDRCNLAAALSAQARHQPDAPAIHYPARGGYRTLSYAELDQLTDRLARGLRVHGMGRGARVALMVPPRPEFFALFFALFKAGSVPVLIDPGIGLQPLKACLAEAAPAAFIGVTRAQVARLVLGWGRASIRRTVTVGPRPLWQGLRYHDLLTAGDHPRPDDPLADSGPEDTAAILFTSGSTGPPKGVVYRHRHFVAQVDLLRDTYGIEPGEVSLPTFPPFALFDPALGMTTVVPEMDPTRPAEADPRKLIAAIERFGVTTVFGSPALLRVLGDHCAAEGIELDTVRRVISAGAAVPIPVIRTMERALPEGGRVHTGYGATECLPVASLSSADLDAQTERLQFTGEGVCVGQPVSPNEVRIIALSELPAEEEDDVTALPPGVTGEIMVHGPTTTDSYWRRDEATRLAKYRDARNRTWHRMGDIGYLDGDGRLWYCGRKSQRVDTGDEVLFADQWEAWFNTCEGVRRTALVGVGPLGAQEAVLCVERQAGTDRQSVIDGLRAMAQRNPRTRGIAAVLDHPGFPVDIRHNAKIGRERLAEWAAGRLA